MKYLIPMLLITAFMAVPQLSKAQLIKTHLKITVIDGTGNLVEGAEVQLFTSDADFKKEQNPATDKLKTDEKGVVVFKELKARVYYVLATKGDLNNWGGGIQTDKLKEKKVNKINIVID